METDGLEALTLKDYCSPNEESVLVFFVMNNKCKLMAWRPWKATLGLSNVVFEGELGCKPHGDSLAAQTTPETIDMETTRQ